MLMRRTSVSTTRLSSSYELRKTYQIKSMVERPLCVLVDSAMGTQIYHLVSNIDIRPYLYFRKVY